VTSIHHPWGFPKKISRYYSPIIESDFDDGTLRAKMSFWKIKQWDRGTTDNGSSGAPLFNSNHLLIGTLTGGSAECGFPYNDYFSKFSTAFGDSDGSTNLKNWLDPVGSGVQVLEGLEGGKEILPDEFDELVVYPNPTSLSTIMVNLPFAQGETIQLRITDVFAKEHLVDYQRVDNKIELNLSRLPAGLYLLNISYDGQNFTNKFIKNSIY
jgi:hypothetical protein